MIDCRFRPLVKWPGFPTKSQDRGSRHAFKATYGNTLDMLERELRRLNATNIVIEAYFALNQIRNDGWPFGKATPSEPGVVVSFQSTHGPLKLPCDHFPNWEHNLRAIAYHLEHLRLASLYGVGLKGEAYTGWKQIAAPGASESAMTVEDAARFIAVTVEPQADLEKLVRLLVGSVESYRSWYRDAAGKLHPDVGGLPERWHLLVQARAVLDTHFGLTKPREDRG